MNDRERSESRNRFVEQNGIKREDSLLLKWFRVGRSYHAVLEQTLNSTGVYRSQHRILMCIADHPNISQKALAEMNSVSTATIAVSIKKLEKGGYISREMDAEDNRYNQICLTEKGQEVVEKSRQLFMEAEKALFQDFGEKEFSELEALLDRMYDNLQPFLKK